jgi:hypothetical protein
MSDKSIAHLPKLVVKIGSIVAVTAGVWGTGLSMAQVNVKVPGANVSVGGKNDNNVSVSVGGKNDVGNTAGSIDDDVEMEGVAIINGSVTIDGEKLPKGKTRHTGKKSGIKYVIKWGKDGNVAVSQE